MFSTIYILYILFIYMYTKAFLLDKSLRKNIKEEMEKLENIK